MAPVGRYKTNKKLMLKYRLLGQTLAETLADPDTGEVLAQRVIPLTRKPEEAGTLPGP